VINISVDLSDFTQSFLYEVNPVGQTLVAPSSDEITNRLADSFWECRLSGFLIFQLYTCNDSGIISLQVIAQPTYPDANNPYAGQAPANMPREYIQLIVLMAGYRALITAMQNVANSTTAKAGSVEFSTSHSTSMYIGALKALTAKIDIALTRLSDLGSTSVAVLDAVIDSTANIVDGNSWFVSAGNDYPNDGWNGY
jgi:hypothetical protein